MSKQQLQYDAGKVFVKTELYNLAKQRLDEKNIVVLIGHPGEGKTVMATNLLLSCSDLDRCVRFSLPIDWSYVDSRRIQGTLIDSIFGACFNSVIIDDWSYILPEVEILAKKKGLKVVVTARKDTLKNALGYLGQTSIFRSARVFNLDSRKLSEDDKKEILLSHMKCKSRNISEGLLESCVNAWMSSSLQNKDLTFGFPKCAEMFARVDDFYEKGSSFFSNPIEFFLDCIRNMKVNNVSFLALLTLWTCSSIGLDINSLNKHLKNVETFGFNCDASTEANVRQYLEEDDNGFTRLDETNGVVTFNHSVISDGVGIVAGKDNPRPCLEFSTIDFLLQYITSDKMLKDSRYHIYVAPYMFQSLVEKFMYELSKHQNKILVSTFLDILRHDAFYNDAFVDKFVRCLKGNCPPHLFTQQVETIEGGFQNQGFIIEKMHVHVPTYCIIDGHIKLFKELIQHAVLEQYMEEDRLDDEMYLCLLHSVLEGRRELVKFLLQNGCNVSEEALFIALMNGKYDLLDMMAKAVKKRITSKCTFEEDNLMGMAVKMGKDKLIRRIARYTNLGYRDPFGCSALYHAFNLGNIPLFRVLTESGANLDYKYSEKQQTLLHIASEHGLLDVADVLLTHGARVDIKDRSGKCPIHCAAFAGRTRIAELLLRHDPTQAGKKLTTHADKSIVKGMTFLHIAVWKKRWNFIKNLIPVIEEVRGKWNHTDYYGRTALYCAAFDGESEKVIKDLIEISDINLPDKSGFTPLHAATHRSKTNIAKLICRAGANVNAVDKYGKTPLHVATERNDAKLVSFLIKHGADYRMITKRKETVFHLLGRKKKKDNVDITESVRILKEADPDFFENLKTNTIRM